MIPAARSFDHDEPTTNISNTSTADSVGPWINVTGIANASRIVPQTLLSATAGSNRHCTAADEAHITAAGPGNEDGTFPKIVMECGTKAYSWFRFHTDRYERCVQDNLHITSSCARCLTPPAEYVVRHCKGTCMRHGWCAKECLSCGAPSAPASERCAGFRFPETEECNQSPCSLVRLPELSSGVCTDVQDLSRYSQIILGRFSWCCPKCKDTFLLLEQVTTLVYCS